MSAAMRTPGGDPDIRRLMKHGIVHFMGISGSGMCSLAEALARAGGQVTGCDHAPGIAAEPLRRAGVIVHDTHGPSHLEGVSALVVTAAVPNNHPELARARDLGIPVLKRARALGQWVNGGFVAAVAGTHGKTTTTAVLTEILARAGKDPTGFVGGWVESWEGHLRVGSADLFVVEADEYDRSFHHLRPSLAVVTNLEPDHLDVYGDMEGVREAFRTFLKAVREDGQVVAGFDDPGIARVLTGVSPDVVTFGLEAGSEVRGVGLERSGSGTRFRIVDKGIDRGRFDLSLSGDHNVRNALGAAAAAVAMGASWDDVRAALAEFSGVARRFQRLGEVGGVIVVDDYAHHPTELAAALSAARDAYPGRRVVAVFQPHLFSRTRDFARDFGEVLARADLVWIAEIYPARERPIAGVDGGFLAAEVRRAVARGMGSASEVRFHDDLDALPSALSEELRDGDLCLTLGAGSIERVGPELVRRLQSRMEVAHA